MTVDLRRLGTALLLWAVPLAASGLFITFSVNHSPVVGLIGLVVLSFGTAIARAISAWMVVGLGAPWLWTNAAAAAGSLVVGVIGSIFLTQPLDLGLVITLTSTWAAVVAACDAFAALRVSHRQLTRELRVLTIASGLLAVTLVALPLSSVFVVGLLGAYGVVTAVYLAIAGMSFRFDSSARAAEESRSA